MERCLRKEEKRIHYGVYLYLPLANDNKTKARFLMNERSSENEQQRCLDGVSFVLNWHSFLIPASRYPNVDCMSSPHRCVYLLRQSESATLLRVG